MRPVYIEISAFGPYAGKVCVEFDRMGEEGLFLVAGDTGAGKTTVFDAISFALFGLPSGNDRQPKMLRSMYAEPSVPTYVYLEFVCRGKLYKVKRNPAYDRPKLRGEGVTTESAAVELILPDGSIIANSNMDEANKKITEIIGVDREQFSKIAMIAQGEFRDFLLKDSKDKIEIMRKLFRTENYEIFQNKLKDLRSETARNCEDLKKTILIPLKNIGCDEKNEYYAELVNLKNILDDKDKTPPAEKFADLAEKIISEDAKKLEELSKSETDAKNKMDKAEKELEARKNLADAETKLNEAEKQLTDLNKKQAELKEKKEAAEKQKPKETELTGTIATEREKLKNYDELDDVDENIKKTDKKIKECEDNKKKAEKSVEDANEQLKAVKEEFDRIKNAGEEAAKLKNKVIEIKNSIEDLSNLKKYAKSTQDAEKIANVETDNYLCAKTDADKAREKYNIAYRNFLDAQAGILATQLLKAEAETGEKQRCPVCGSLEHPHPAELSQSAVTGEELDELEEKKKSAEKNESEKSKYSGEKKAEFTKEKEKFEELASKFPDFAFTYNDSNLISEEIENKNSEKSELEKQLKTCENNKKRAKEIDEEERQKLEEKIKTETDNKNEFENHLSGLKSHLGGLINQKTRVLSKLDYDSKEKAKEHINALESELKKLSDAIEDAVKAYETNKNAVSEASGRVEELRKSKTELAGKCDETLAKTATNILESEKQATEELLSEIDEKKDKIKNRNTLNINAVNEIRDISVQLAKDEEEYVYIKELCDTVNGNIGSGKDKIKLETYVQMIYFERVLERANQRFIEMSGGQYEFVRREVLTDARKQGGLDINIIDHYNGTERDVKTLSGGESFLASLSLALGLSDEVQSEAGGVCIESMFIDEGFGTLDETSLGKAVEVLDSLASNNTLIGIISHVAELKNRIERRLIIKKEKSGGSSIELESDL